MRQRDSLTVTKIPVEIVVQKHYLSKERIFHYQNSESHLLRDLLESRFETTEAYLSPSFGECTIGIRSPKSRAVNLFFEIWNFCTSVSGTYRKVVKWGHY